MGHNHPSPTPPSPSTPATSSSARPSHRPRPLPSARSPFIMSSNLKIQTARANGAKSRGPATPEGRAKSSRNSLRHGLSAKSVVLPAESHEQFQLLLDAHIQQFQPANDVEMELVEAMAVSRWRLRRIWAIETSLLDHELQRRAEDMDDEFTEMSAEDRLAWVFHSRKG